MTEISKRPMKGPDFEYLIFTIILRWPIISVLGIFAGFPVPSEGAKMCISMGDPTSLVIGSWGDMYWVPVTASVMPGINEVVGYAG